MAQGAILGKAVIEGTIVCRSGLRIGANADVMEIGGVDMPVVRDPVTEEPYLPGSSVRGKLRSLMERRRYTELLQSSPSLAAHFFNRNIAPRGAPPVRHHECSRDDCLPCRIFGVSRGGPEQSNAQESADRVLDNRPGRLLVRDCWLLNRDELSVVASGLFTEIKYENSLDRITSAASPRQVERVPRGAKFSFKAVYTADSLEEARADLNEIMACLRLLEDDYLGGCGSRGCGEIAFEGLTLKWRTRGFYEGTEDETAKPIDLALAQAEIDSVIAEALGG